jgi:spore germination cell wall hydrolase CwlJ-like protein
MVMMWRTLVLLGVLTTQAQAAHPIKHHHSVQSKSEPVSKPDRILRTVEIIPPVQDQSTTKRKEILCLTLGMYQEARSESEIGQRAVAHVILNLTAGRSICDTLWLHGKFPWVKRSVNQLTPTNVEKPIWREVQATAMRVLTKDDPDPTRGATMFYNEKLCKPNWAKDDKITAKFGNHVFIRP